MSVWYPTDQDREKMFDKDKRKMGLPGGGSDYFILFAVTEDKGEANAVYQELKKLKDKNKRTKYLVRLIPFNQEGKWGIYIYPRINYYLL